MNIGLLITRFPPDQIGGAELQASRLAGQLAKRGHSVTVFTRRYLGRPFVQRQNGYLVRRRRELPVPALRMVWDTFPALWQIARLRPRPDVLLCYQTLNSGMIGVVAQAVLGIPAVVSVRGNTEYRLHYSVSNRLLVPTVYRLARRLIVQSPRILDDLHKQLTFGAKSGLSDSLHSKTTVIPNGVDVSLRTRASGGKVVFIGRLIEGKGVGDLLEAMKHFPETELVIVGDGPDRERLESLAAGLRVSFVGEVAPEDVPTYLNQARTLVLPSRLGDGLPNVVLEAMTCGVPVITTQTAGMPDLVRHGETGLLFEPGDVHQLTGHIERLLGDDHLWRRLGERSMEVVKSYSWDAVTPQVEQLLLDVTRNGTANMMTV